MLTVKNVASFSKRKKADILIVPFYQGDKKAVCAHPESKLIEAQSQAVLSSGDFLGKMGTTALVYSQSMPETRLLLIGLGKSEKIGCEELRRAYGKAAGVCHEKKARHVNLLFPEKLEMNSSDVARSCLEGILSENYYFTMKNKLDEPVVRIEQLDCIAVSTATMKSLDATIKIFEGVYSARHLVNKNADDVSPQYLGETALDLAKKHKKLKTTVWNKARLEKEGFHLLLAVGRAGKTDPSFIIMEYQGSPKSKDKTIIVGKGITYDTGGLNLKPTGSMETMKCDMSGAAAVLGTMEAICALDLPVNVCGLIPTCENGIDSMSYKPGDVYQSYKGLSVEIGNTDAEGRLILADALAYACDRLAPSRIIDLATLTGAMVVTLGEEVAGMMTTSDTLAASLEKSGQATFERVWRFPLFEEYQDLLKSDFADIKNIGGRSAGSITAALFLKKFVDDKIPWAHLDIAGTAYLSSKQRYLPKNATGYGVRLLVDFLTSLKA